MYTLSDITNKLHEARDCYTVYRRGTDGKLHCVDGPAVIHKDGDVEWWLNGRLHRLDGPAIEYNSCQHQHWFINGSRVMVKSQEEFEQWLKINKTIESLPRQKILDI